MQLYALIGKTGTGKSYNAQKVAKDNSIDYIIDDAILIKSTKVIAGKSAKTEASKIASVKSAIFLNEIPNKEMKRILKKEKPDKLLILGTSDNMVEKIAKNLDLGDIFKRIYIEDITTQEQIEKARNSRVNEGKHVVPVPTFEIKKQFSGYFLDSLKIFDIFTNKENGTNVIDSTEKTIIRPTYSYLGKYYISDNVINAIIHHVVEKVPGVTKVMHVSTEKYIDGMKLDVDLEIKFGVNIPKISSGVKNTCVVAIDKSTGINLFGININIKSIKY